VGDGGDGKTPAARSASHTPTSSINCCSLGAAPDSRF
jgi:hypothetical protein